MSEPIQKPTPEQIKSAFADKFPDVAVSGLEDRRLVAKVPREIVHDVCQYLHDEMCFEHCSVVMGTDFVDHMTVNILPANYYNGVMVDISVDLPADDLHIDSVTDIWEGANWHERETWELFGIVFDNHPKLERLLTPKTYEFFPFRKSYKLRGSE